ncbi:MAG: hypothetical protein WAW37_11445 [Syntrophobacteraceae bacterium]
MKPDPVSHADLPELTFGTPMASPVNDGQGFDKALKAAAMEYSGPRPEGRLVPEVRPGTGLMSEARPIVPEGTEFGHEALRGPAIFSPSKSLKAGPNEAEAAAAYQQAMERTTASNAIAPGTTPAAVPAQMSDFEKYKDDQLLRNPGGRNYYHDEKKVVENSPEQRSFFGRIGKNFSSVVGNIKNFVGNIFLGSNFLYRGRDNEIKEARTKGFVGTVVNFFKDLGSALSLGSYHPDKAEAPQGVKDRLVYAAGKFKDAFFGDLAEGIPSSLNHMGKNLVLAGWRLAQVLPDATIGNFEEGRKLTTSIFDNGHVAVEYITDVLPTGDAWLRVHASSLRDLQPPVLYNIDMPENHSGDTRWQYVRNTPFRKSIETLGSLLADAAGIYLIGQTGCSSNRHSQVE